jgi:glucokinase
MAVLGVDIGGTNIRTAVFPEPGRMLQRQQIRGRDLGIPAPVNAFVDLIKTRLEQAQEIADIDAIGVSVAAVVDHKRGYIKVGENVGWQDVYLKEIMERELHLPVSVEADAFCGAGAEARLGNGKDYDNLLYVAIGTAIGHSLVLNGKVWHGEHNAANVFGHIKTIYQGEPCYCGGNGCVCQYSAGKGLARSGQLSYGQAEPQLRGEDVVKAYWNQESWAVSAIEEAHVHLGMAISAAYNLLDLECTILGGGAVSEIYPNLDRLCQILEELVYPQTRPIVLRRGALGADAIITGAALLAFDMLNGKV